MLRIVGVQRDMTPEKEFLLLQNQGSLRVVLKGHVVMAERAVLAGDLCRFAHVFSEDESIHPGLYALLSTGSGLPHWGKTRDGSHVYHAYAGRQDSLWWSCDGPVHVLSPCHSYCERVETLILR
jgi:hypothetical protein